MTPVKTNSCMTMAVSKKRLACADCDHELRANNALRRIECPSCGGWITQREIYSWLCFIISKGDASVSRVAELLGVPTRQARRMLVESEK